MQIYKYQTLETTVDALASTKGSTDRSPAGTIGYVVDFVEGEWVRLIARDKNDKPIEVELTWNEVKPVYNDKTFKMKRPLYNAPICPREIEVAFAPITIKRGVDLVGRVLDGIQPFGGIIAGSYAAWMVAPDYVVMDGSVVPIRMPQPKDLDIFCTRPSQKHAILKLLRDLDYSNSRDSEFVTSLSLRYGHHNSEGLPQKVQVVDPAVLHKSLRTDTPEAVIDTFDFTVCRALVADREHAIADINFVEDVANKELRLMRIHDPIRGSARMRKYELKGYLANRYTRYLYFEAMRLMPKSEQEVADMVAYGNRLKARDQERSITNDDFFDEYD